MSASLVHAAVAVVFAPTDVFSLALAISLFDVGEELEECSRSASRKLMLLLLLALF